MSNQHVTEAEGIIDKDIDQSIRNLTSLGKHANERDGYYGVGYYDT